MSSRSSALLAVEESRLTLSARRGCESILAGYTESLRAGGGAAVLAERYRWLRDLAVARLKDQRSYWDHMCSLRTVSGRVDPRVRRGRKKTWLTKAAERMSEAVTRDWRTWRNGMRGARTVDT